MLADIDRRGDADAIYHLGDLVGYSSNPNAVIDRLRERGISGNYDSTVATHNKHCGCKSENPRQEELAHISYEYTRATVTPEGKRYLRGLPFSLDLRPHGGHASGPRLVLVHGTPTLNTLHWTEDRSDDFCLKMAAIVGLKAGDVIAFGHTHRPWHREVQGIHFVNTGSVGRPKDGDPRAGYVRVALSETGVLAEFVRVPYDVDATIAGVRAAGLPEDFRTSCAPVAHRRRTGCCHYERMSAEHASAPTPGPQVPPPELPRAQWRRRTLRQLRLVRFRKVGKIAYYSLDDSHVAQLVAEGLGHIDEETRRES